MIRISVSDLETYRYWKASDDSTVEGLISRLTKQDPPTPQMEAGRAFAKLVEHASERALFEEEQDGWTFFFHFDAEITWPHVRELKTEMVIQTPVGPATLVVVCDAMDGRVHDAKLTESIDVERYLDSLQWRAYLAMFGAKEFVYHLFKAKYEREPGRTDEGGTYHKGAVRKGPVMIEGYEAVRFFAYPKMREDVERAVCELAEVMAGLNIGRVAA